MFTLSSSHGQPQKTSEPCFCFYLDIRFLSVHKFLDDFPQSICIRKVASQWSGRWILVVLLSIHVACLDFLEVSAECTDLFCTLLSEKKHTSNNVLDTSCTTIISKFFLFCSCSKFRGQSMPLIFISVYQDGYLDGFEQI